MSQRKEAALKLLLRYKKELDKISKKLRLSSLQHQEKFSFLHEALKRQLKDTQTTLTCSATHDVIQKRIKASRFYIIIGRMLVETVEQPSIEQQLNELELVYTWYETNKGDIVQGRMFDGTKLLGEVGIDSGFMSVKGVRTEVHNEERRALTTVKEERPKEEPKRAHFERTRPKSAPVKEPYQVFMVTMNDYFDNGTEAEQSVENLERESAEQSTPISEVPSRPPTRHSIQNTRPLSTIRTPFSERTTLTAKVESKHASSGNDVQEEAPGSDGSFRVPAWQQKLDDIAAACPYLPGKRVIENNESANRVPLREGQKKYSSYGIDLDLDKLWPNMTLRDLIEPSTERKADRRSSARSHTTDSAWQRRPNSPVSGVYTERSSPRHTPDYGSQAYGFSYNDMEVRTMRSIASGPSKRSVRSAGAYQAGGRPLSRVDVKAKWSTLRQDNGKKSDSDFLFVNYHNNVPRASASPRRGRIMKTGQLTQRSLEVESHPLNSHEYLRISSPYSMSRSHDQ